MISELKKILTTLPEASLSAGYHSYSSPIG
jgi:hypothetical protein